MLPLETRLEIRRRLPAAGSHRPPLVFVHGGYCDAWFWDANFLPWFAARGYPAYALSLRGHGTSGGTDSLFMAGLDDYEADVEHVAGMLSEPPVFIGHSMGAAVVERIVAKRPVRGAVLLAPVPPAGLLPIASRLAREHPDYLVHIAGLDPTRLSGDVLSAMRPFYFSEAVRAGVLAEVQRHLSAESPRALFDLSLRLHWVLPSRDHRPLFVLGAEGDRICCPEDVRATARHHGVEAVLVPGLAHMLMLEPGWERAAQAIETWIARLGVT